MNIYYMSSSNIYVLTSTKLNWNIFSQTCKRSVLLFFCWGGIDNLDKVLFLVLFIF